MTQIEITVNWRDELVRMVQDEIISAEALAIMVAKWLTNDDIEEMLDANELTPRFVEGEEE